MTETAYIVRVAWYAQEVNAIAGRRRVWSNAKHTALGWSWMVWRTMRNPRELLNNSRRWRDILSNRIAREWVRYLQYRRIPELAGPAQISRDTIRFLAGVQAINDEVWRLAADRYMQMEYPHVEEYPRAYRGII